MSLYPHDGLQLHVIGATARTVFTAENGCRSTNIFNAALELNCALVELTGGEPLLQPGVPVLSGEAAARGKNGARRNVRRTAMDGVRRGR